MAHPRIVSRGAAARTLARLRKACLALPDAAEKEAWGRPTFRARERMFAMFLDDHHGDDRVAVWCKATHDVQDALVAGDPEQFFVPPYVGPSGWVGVRHDRGIEWRRVEALLQEAWRLAAPKRLAARSVANAVEQPARSARKPAHSKAPAKRSPARGAARERVR